MTKLEEMRETLGDVPERWLGRPLLLNCLDSPPERVEVRAGRVLWTSRLEKEGRRRHNVKEGLLDDFLKLRDATEREIRAFVQKWGPLRLCTEHSLPADHLPIVEGKCSGLPQIDCEHDDGAITYSEGAEAYRMYSSVAFQLLWIENKLRRCVPLTSEDWPNFSRWPHFRPLPGWRKSSDADELKKILPAMYSPRGRLAAWMNTWLWVADVRPFVFAHAPSQVDESGKFEVEFAGPSRVFGAIGLQLVAAVTGSTGLVICAECGQPLFARKHPAQRNRYCDQCGAAAAHRQASRGHYRKNAKDILGRRKAKRASGVKDSAHETKEKRDGTV